MRCLALAAELQRQGAEVLFFSVKGAAEVVPALARSGFAVQTLDDARSPLEGVSLDALVVDHYGLSAEHEARFREHASVIAVIDDLADRMHDCDILLDTTAGREALAYGTLAPGAECLMGSGYALLRPAFASLRPASLARHASAGALDRILVSFGLTDPGGVTAAAAEALLASGTDASIDVVVRRDTAAWSQLRLNAAHSQRLRLHDDPLELAELMATADLAIGGGGVTSWERCCLGLPTIVAELADNQRDNIAALTTFGAAVPLRDPQNLAHELTGLVSRLSNPETRRTMSQAASRLCDGEGARRVAAVILKTIAVKTDSWRSA
jgi:UDP-2,4-diacetamido-2,4,6-trideoxy-beta-L-altropyranose hydrolase